MDARSDIFSFGSVLYEMVTGKRAFQGDSKISTLAAIVNEEPCRCGAVVPSRSGEAICRCLRKDPARRFQHMDDVRRTSRAERRIDSSGKLATSVPTDGVGLGQRGGTVPIAGAVSVWRGQKRHSLESRSSP